MILVYTTTHYEHGKVIRSDNKARSRNVENEPIS
jgi:hypothetical protein